MNGMTPHQPHTSMSISKSIMGAVCGILVGKGLFDTNSPVTRYLPELESTAYRDATVRHVLDMTTGVGFTEGWSTLGTDAYLLLYASGWRPAVLHPDNLQTQWQLILTLTGQARPHGEQFVYRDNETKVLGFIMQRASGKRLAELVSTDGRRLWRLSHHFRRL